MTGNETQLQPIDPWGAARQNLEASGWKTAEQVQKEMANRAAAWNEKVAAYQQATTAPGFGKAVVDHLVQGRDAEIAAQQANAAALGAQARAKIDAMQQGKPGYVPGPIHNGQTGQ